MIGAEFSLHNAPQSEIDLAAVFQRYAEATRQGIAVIDAAGIVSYVNQSLCHCFGYEADELLGLPIQSLFPTAADIDLLSAGDVSSLNGQSHLMRQREVQGRRKDGGMVDLAIGLTPLGRDHRNRASYTMISLSELHPAERTLANFFDLSLDLFCIASTQGCFLRINPNFTRLLGYSEQELLSAPILDFVHADDVSSTRNCVASMVAGTPLVRFRNRFRNSLGGYRWIEWNGRCLAAYDLIFAVGRDVTDEVQLEREMHVWELREQAILENTPAVVYVKALDGRYLYVNQRFIDLFSLDANSVVGKTDADIFPPEAARNFARNDRRVAETRCKLTIEETAPHPDGLHTYLSVKFPFFDARGDVSAVAGISTDITEHLRNEQLRNQLDVAKAFQSKLFPAQAPAVAGLDIAGSAVPVTHLCGDYYDFIVTGPERLVIAVGDVSGHGLGPALAMVEVRSIVRAMAKYGEGCELAQVLHQLNQTLCDDLPDGAFVTLFLAEIDVAQGQLQYAGAGHQALLIRRDSSLVTLKSTGACLGLLDSAAYMASPRLSVGPDDLLVICTDGVAETMNESRDLFGTRRLAEFCQAHRGYDAQEIIQRLFVRVTDFAGQRPIADDVTGVVVKFRG